ncbi:MAG: glycosyltransferase family 2 protein [Sulfitobacter sp.]
MGYRPGCAGLSGHCPDRHQGDDGLNQRADTPTRWGLVATVLAPTRDILQFAAYHLEAGAHRLYLYLDDDTCAAYPALKAHPKIRVTRCDAAHWQKLTGKRPKKHQVRQSQNATHAYRRRVEVDWLAHIDVDEFLVSDQPVATFLASVPPDCLTLRMHPMEALAGGASAFKAYVKQGPDRAPTVQALYPTYGAYLRGGFLSHVAGKIFLRTGLDGIELRIHNGFQGGVMNPGGITQDVIVLAHYHAPTWKKWRQHYAYRLDKGAYRPDLPPADKTGVTNLHDLLTSIEADEGEAGLRRFFDEVCADTPALRARLQARGLLRLHDLDLDATLSRHFPDFAG